MILRTIAITLISCALSGVAGAAAKSGRPNILLIVADDLGYADLGVYGGDVDTPNIDNLASQGILFTQFHTAPLCSPTRAMLLSGNNNHVAGVANQGRTGAAGLAIPGYEASLSDRIVPFPKLLRDSGYHTYIAGKWHLGGKEGQRPRDAGFTRSLAMVQGGASHFDSRGYTPAGATYMADGNIVERPPNKYSTEMFTDTLITFIEADKDSGRPFMAYAAYTSPHWPLQVPDDYLDLYKGRYDDGYDTLRERRFESLKEAGIIPGIKVDKGTKHLAGSQDELITEGLDGLRERLEEYLELGSSVVRVSYCSCRRCQSPVRRSWRRMERCAATARSSSAWNGPAPGRSARWT